MDVPTCARGLEIRKSVKDPLRVDGALEVTGEDLAGFRADPFPILVMDRSRPAHLGWSCSPTRAPESDQGTGGGESPGAGVAPGRSFEFSYYFDSADERDTLFPTGRSSYVTRAEPEPGPGTFWFPLPRGRSLHDLLNHFGLTDEPSLPEFVVEWFSERESRSAMPFKVETDPCVFNQSAVGIYSRSRTAARSAWLEIPAALLRDPIRNGSVYLEHGFNPWNEDQKAQIVAHLEQELVRLRGNTVQ